MSIICLEGASAVGKTTVSQYLEQKYGYRRIAEVNELFLRPLNASKTWYFERQVERWQQAKKFSDQGKVAILDGDPFQPLWYNWIYASEKLQSTGEVFNYYHKMILSGEIEFPANYFVLTTTIPTLIARKKADLIRTRRNFNKHLTFISPQRSFFKYMGSLKQNSVIFLESDFPKSVAEKIAESNKLSQCADNQALIEAMQKFTNTSQIITK